MYEHTLIHKIEIPSRNNFYIKRYEVYDEIKAQESEIGLEFDYIFLPVGTGMTIAGLIAGKIEHNDMKNIRGYGLYDDDVIRTIRIMLRHNGIAMDTTYTGKAFNGMLRYLEENNIVGRNILFIHTGGTPLFFDSL